LASRSVIVVFSGSLPKGLPATFYAELVDIVKSEGALAFLDTSGEALAAGVRSLPFFIKPNEDEVAQLLGKPMERESDLYGGIRRLMDSGIGCVVVSLGEKGAVAGFQGRLYRVIAPRVEAVNAVGCGDSFVAGMAVAISRKRPIEECLRLAAAAGSANALTEEAGNVRPEDVQRLFEQVRVEPIEA
jgi:tagatose 6-phosphate kinase